MDLKEAAAMLGVSPDTVRRWARQGSLGTMRPSGEFRFDPDELDAWAKEHGIHLQRSVGDSEEAVMDSRPFTASLERGGIHRDLTGKTPAALLEDLVGRLPLEEGKDRERLLEQLLGREDLASTGLGRGVALPHPRQPSTEFSDQPLATIGYPASPLDWKALDGEDVHTLILLVNPNPASHLKVLSRAAFLLKDESFESALRERAPDEKIFEVLEGLEPQSS